jgi:hypothetical protein
MIMEQKNEANNNSQSDISQENNFKSYKQEIDQKFTDLSTKIDKEIPKKFNNCFCTLFRNHWFLIGIIIILLGAVVFMQFHVITGINETSIILAFVGILSTFIVVSNYVQVKEVKDDFSLLKNSVAGLIDEKISESETRIKENLREINKDFVEKVQEDKGNIDEVEKYESRIKSIENKFNIEGEISFLLSVYYYTLKGIIYYESKKYKESFNCYMDVKY